MLVPRRRANDDAPMLTGDLRLNPRPASALRPPAVHHQCLQEDRARRGHDVIAHRGRRPRNPSDVDRERNARTDDGRPRRRNARLNAGRRDRWLRRRRYPRCQQAGWNFRPAHERWSARNRAGLNEQHPGESRPLYLPPYRWWHDACRWNLLHRPLHLRHRGCKLRPRRGQPPFRWGHDDRGKNLKLPGRQQSCPHRHRRRWIPPFRWGHDDRGRNLYLRRRWMIERSCPDRHWRQWKPID